MSDRFATSIILGGPIAIRQVPKLVEALAGWDIDWNESGLDAKSLTTHLLSIVPFKITMHECTYDEWEQTLSKIRKLRIAYLSHQEAKYEYDHDLRTWRPGMKRERSSYCLEDGTPCLSYTELVIAAKEKTLHDVIEGLEDFRLETADGNFPRLTLKQ